MVTYDEVKNRLLALRQNVLKYQLFGVLNRRLSMYSAIRNAVKNVLTQINDALSADTFELASGYAIQQYVVSRLPSVGKKYVEFSYADETIPLTGLDGQSYDNPSFPQMKITDEDRAAMESNMKNISAEIAKRRVVLRCSAGDAGSVGDPDAEDALYAYYYAEATGYYELHDVNYESVLGISPIVFDAPTYFAIDMEIPRRLRLLKVTAYSFVYSWFGGDVVVGLDINPTLTVCDPDDDTKKRITTGSYVVNAQNNKSTRFELLVDTYVIPVKPNTHALILLGGELTGISGTLVMAEKSI